jgi:hypothetical protein
VEAANATRAVNRADRCRGVPGSGTHNVPISKPTPRASMGLGRGQSAGNPAATIPLAAGAQHSSDRSSIQKEPRNRRTSKLKVSTTQPVYGGPQSSLPILPNRRPPIAILRLASLQLQPGRCSLYCGGDGHLLSHPAGWSSRQVTFRVVPENCSRRSCSASTGAGQISEAV